jgi:hypothetical protein
MNMDEKGDSGFRFQRLVIWQRAADLAVKLDEVSGDRFELQVYQSPTISQKVLEVRRHPIFERSFSSLGSRHSNVQACS